MYISGIEYSSDCNGSGFRNVLYVSGCWWHCEGCHNPETHNKEAGVNKSVAENIVKYRNENGEFKSREELKKVPKLGPKAFEQCIGFLRILNGKNILDQTSIHPESYDLALKILNKLEISASDLGKDELKEKINKINVKD